MFTGIVEGMGKVSDIKKEGTNFIFFIESIFAEELKVNQEELDSRFENKLTISLALPCKATKGYG